MANSFLLLSHSTPSFSNARTGALIGATELSPQGLLCKAQRLSGGGGNRTRVEPRQTQLGNDQKRTSTRSFVLTVRDRDCPLVTPLLCPYYPRWHRAAARLSVPDRSRSPTVAECDW